MFEPRYVCVSCPLSLYQLDKLIETISSLIEAVFSLICGTSALMFYGWLYVYILKALPQSFTFGEAAVVAQGFVLFLLNAGLRLFAFASYNDEHAIDEVTLILQVS